MESTLKNSMLRQLDGREGQALERLLNLDDPDFDPEAAIQRLRKIGEMAEGARIAIRAHLNQ